MKIAAELFEGEVQASLSEWWMPREYGMLQKGELARTRARLDSLHVGFGRQTEHVASVDESDAGAGSDSDSRAAPLSTSQPPDNSATAETQKLLRALVKRSGWVLATLVALLIVTLLK